MTKKYFFSHDYKARSDSKMMDCQMKFGMAGIGLYWCLVEMLYESNGFIMHSQCDRIAFEMRVHKDRIAELIQETDLFDSDSEKFWSNSVLERLEFIETKSKKGKDAAKKRWNNADASKKHADASNKNADASILQWEEDKTKQDKTRLNKTTIISSKEEIIAQTVSPSEVDSSRYQLNRASENPPQGNKQLFYSSFSSLGIDLSSIGTEKLYSSLVDPKFLDQDEIWDASEGKFDKSTLASYLRNKFPRNYTDVEPFKAARKILNYD
jgi:hypothetical protein